MSSTTASSGTAAQAAAQEGRPDGKRLLLAVCCVAQFMVILDLSIVNVALPHIQSALEFSSPELEWIVDAYAITFAGFLMFGGRAADHWGQRRTFVISLVAFGLASLMGGLAPDQAVLIAARALQGLAGAFMAACSLAIITASFEPGPKLHRAIATWAAMNGLGGAAGMLFGGVIVEFLSWRWVLLINPPIGIAAAFVAYAVVAERRRGKEARDFDRAGALTLTVGQMALVFGVVEAGLKGWSSFSALGPIIAGIVLLVAFQVIETRFAKDPLIPFKELTRPLQNANTIVLLFSASLFPMWFVATLYLQQVLGLSPLKTGLIFLPMTAMIGLTAPRAGKLVGHFGVRPVLGSGLVMLTAGMLLESRLHSSGSGIIYIMMPGLLTAAGIAMSIVPSTIAATQGAKEGQAGLASGLVNTSRQVGGGLGLAVLVTLATQRSSHLIGQRVQVPEALTSGFRLALEIGGGLAAAAAIMTFLTVPRSEAPAASVRKLAAVVGLALAVFIGLTIAFSGNKGPLLGKYSLASTHSYVTEPGLHPPVIKVIKSAPESELAPGLILTANFFNVSFPPIRGQSGPMILDYKMQPVWFQPVPEKYVAGNLTAQHYEGKPVLTWWQGRVTNTGATEVGEDVIVNQHYQPIARLKATGGWVITLHEFIIEGEDAWVTANKNLPMNLSKYGGAYNGAVIDSAVQKYNLRTGKLLYNWDALKHIPLSESQATLPTNGFPWDAYHVNSIDTSRAGHFLVSMRDTWAAYMVNIASGRIEWTLGGRRSSFGFPKGAAFQWQHDVKFGSGDTVTMFDDHCCQLTGGGTYVPPSANSRGLILSLDQQSKEAKLVSEYGLEVAGHPDYMGDTQPLANSNVLLGWGSEPYISEFTRSGKLLWEVEFPGHDLSYRSELAQWEGFPLSDPAGAARRVGPHTTVYASWNGATQLRSWRVLAGESSTQLSPVASAPKSGFETSIPVSGTHSWFELQALGASGKLLGTSKAFKG